MKDYIPSLGLYISIREIPVCEEIVDEMKKYGFNKKEITENIQNNRHNKITTCYYLLVQKLSRDCIEIKSNLYSNAFKEYLEAQNLKNKLVKKKRKTNKFKNNEI